MAEGIRFTPPAEFRGRVEGYKSALSRSRRPAAKPAPAQPAAKASPGK
jgi:hypothetical protein